MKQANGKKRPAAVVVASKPNYKVKHSLNAVLTAQPKQTRSSVSLPVNIRTDILDYIRENHEAMTLEEADVVMDNKTTEELFRMYCVWNGLMGSWSETLITALDAIREYVRGA